ncbi:MAG: hypothetical protein FWF87_01755 [Synergistaceae bacterium]|nr:hypothetical protein [Synergistaceae bacterium]
MEKHKKWCLYTLSVIATILITIASATAIIDPFFHFHGPLKNIPYSLNQQSYINPGIVSHFEYDSLITGSSMTENFKTSYFKKVLGSNAIKVPYSGASVKNMNIILERALKSNPNLKTVYLGLDLPMLIDDPDKTRYPLPYYLYDSSLFSKVQYLLNKDVFFQIGYNILNALKGVSSDLFDDYSYWNNSYTFSQFTVMSSYLNEKKADRQQLTLDSAIRLTHDNLYTNLLPLIESYPNTDFIIFYPPYSILYWHLSHMENELSVLEYSTKVLLPYNNVRLFLFQNVSDIVTNLYNYKDYTHYCADINNLMVDCFKNGTHKLTAENYEAELVKMKDLVRNFDYGILFGESNPFIGENDFIKYLAKLSDARYITFIVTRSDSPVSIDDVLKKQYAYSGFDNCSSFGYVAVLNGNSVIIKESHDEAISFNNKVYELSVNMVSEKRKDKNYMEVTINDVKYTTNQDGVNIVVYDTELQRVMDNIALNISDNTINRR